MAVKPGRVDLPARAARYAGGVEVVMPEATACRLWVELTTATDPALKELRAALAPIALNHKQEDKTP